MKKTNRAHIVIKQAFLRLQKQNPKFSMRALATKLGVSHVFMMKLLRGDATIPDKKIPALIKILSLDDLSKAELKEALVFDAIQEKLAAFPEARKKKMATSDFEEFPARHFSVLDHWYHLPLLDLLTCEIPDKSPKALAMKMGLTSMEVEASLESMSKLGLASFKGGQWEKTSTKIRFPTSIPSEVTRHYYEQVLQRVSMELKQTAPERFSKRSITNLSIAVNPAKVQEAKERLQKFVYELATDLASEETQEVYFLTTCLFPVTGS